MNRPSQLARTLLQAAFDAGAQSDRWVNEGVIQDEYRDLRAHR